MRKLLLLVVLSLNLFLLQSCFDNNDEVKPSEEEQLAALLIGPTWIVEESVAECNDQEYYASMQFKEDGILLTQSILVMTTFIEGANEEEMGISCDVEVTDIVASWELIESGKKMKVVSEGFTFIVDIVSMSDDKIVIYDPIEREVATLIKKNM
ncbi:hypothetical protein [Flammeovirga aprica]|uniref:Lipocalin-like domain-containing protein n=1 Tax=Flammeovirga aprica JL-4 TaxID=694437 RepID=A0A7X9XDI8_9BACT|nr:hypothetical protein [Flammeovirga aprica]NME72897.1 hypothetical protein [Flammeovirga aprica JL-4]